MDVEFQELTFNAITKEEFLLEELFDLKGDDIQKLSVIQTLPQLLQAEPQQAFARLIPKILQELPNSSCEFHVMTSKVFKLLMERQVPVNLFHAVLQGIESRDPIVANAWMETLLAVINVLTETQLKSEIIPLANLKALLSQPVTSRIASSRILGRLAVHKALDPTDVKRDVLPLAQSLCQDCHPDVRTAMCLQLPHIAQGLGTNLIKGNLLTSLVELASDDNMYVRSASVTAIVQMFPYFTLDIKKQTILPLVKQLCDKSLKPDDLTATTIAREIGKLVDGLQFTLSIPDSIWFLEHYRALAHRGLTFNIDEFRSVDASVDVTCRQHCASNLPAISYFTFAVVPTQTDLLYSIFQDLAADPCYIVRRTVAGCLHELVKIFGPQNKLLKSDFVRLLRDDSEDVLQMLVPHMGNTLELFCTYGTLSRQVANQSATEIGRAMLKCQFELTSGYNWRLLTHFIHQLEHLPNCMPPDFIHQHFTPVILTVAVQGRHKPVRSQAARTLLVFLRYNGKEMQRKWIRENMISQLCRSNNCYTRHIFVRLCVNAIDIFSEKYFKEFFFDSLLDLADDRVANIRLGVADLFVVLKRMIVLPEDKLLNARLNDIFRKYSMEEQDRDVLEIFRCRTQEINNPTNTTSKEEHLKEQRRRQNEEERIAAGGKTLLFSNATKRATPKPLSRPNSITKPSSSLDFGASKNLVRSLSLPPKSGGSSLPQNDMSFLEQHFYIDAGVNLPTKPLSNSTTTLNVGKLADSFSNQLQIQNEGTNSSTSENNEGKLSENWPNNITDDDKVTLRKLSVNVNGKKTIIEKKNKRYSTSVLSTTCLEKNDEQKVLNRRSLNITTKELSKIPVSNKSSHRKSKSMSIIIQSNTGSVYGNENKNDTKYEKKYKSCHAEIDLKGTYWSINNPNDSKSKVIKNNPQDNSKDYSFPSGSNDTINSKTSSHLPVFIRRSQSEARK